MTFGEKLKQIRLSKSMSQQDLANLLNTSKQVISRYELGQTTPKIGIAAAWCAILGVNLDNMLNEQKGVYDTEDPPSSQTNKDNTISLIGRDSTKITKTYSDEQMETIRRLLDAIPSEDVDL